MFDFLKSFDFLFNNNSIEGLSVDRINLAHKRTELNNKHADTINGRSHSMKGGMKKKKNKKMIGGAEILYRAPPAFTNAPTGSDGSPDPGTLNMKLTGLYNQTLENGTVANGLKGGSRKSTIKKSTFKKSTFKKSGAKRETRRGTRRRAK